MPTLSYYDMPIQYREGDIAVARIRCQAFTRKGDQCLRFAEWVQVIDEGPYRIYDGRLVCHVHRFYTEQEVS